MFPGLLSAFDSYRYLYQRFGVPPFLVLRLSGGYWLAAGGFGLAVRLWGGSTVSGWLLPGVFGSSAAAVSLGFGAALGPAVRGWLLGLAFGTAFGTAFPAAFLRASAFWLPGALRRWAR